jgi:hypothetical protein
VKGRQGGDSYHLGRTLQRRGGSERPARQVHILSSGAILRLVNCKGMAISRPLGIHATPPRLKHAPASYPCLITLLRSDPAQRGLRFSPIFKMAFLASPLDPGGRRHIHGKPSPSPIASQRNFGMKLRILTRSASLQSRELRQKVAKQQDERSEHIVEELL